MHAGRVTARIGTMLNDEAPMKTGDSSGNRSEDRNRNCVWMEAGMIAYKQCDMEFDCDSCSLDDVMRRQITVADEPPLSSLHSSTPAAGQAGDETPSQRFDRQLDEFLQPLSAVQLPDDRL